MLARRVENHFGEWNPAQLSIFIKQPRDQLIHWRSCWVRRRSPMFLREAFRAAQTNGDKKRDTKHSLIQNPRWRFNKSKRTAVQPQSVLSPAARIAHRPKKENATLAAGQLTMNKSEKIFVAGHRGLVGSSLIRRLEREGFHNLPRRDRSQLNLTDESAVQNFFRKE